jgi:hypothetical protein
MSQRMSDTEDPSAALAPTIAAEKAEEITMLSLSAPATARAASNTVFVLQTV